MSPKVLLADYLKAVPVLTVNDTNISSLKDQQEELEHKYQTKEQEIAAINAQLAAQQATIDKMSSLIQTLADDNTRKVIAHEIKIRKLKGERTDQLTDQEIKEILYEDYLDGFQDQATTKELFRVAEQEAIEEEEERAKRD